MVEDSLKIEKTIRPDGTHERFEIPLGGCIHVISLESGERIARDILSLLDKDLDRMEDDLRLLKEMDNFIASFSVARWVPPDVMCNDCGELLDRRIAIHTGDGWLFTWECPNYCGATETFIEEWPFKREWVTGDDLADVGIEVV